jgi:hypothetical protein
MNDLSGRPIANRGIVMVSTQYFGLQFGVVEEILTDSIRVIIKLANQDEQVIEIENPERNVLAMNYSQLPAGIKARLIELSQVRISGPGELSRNAAEVIRHHSRPDSFKTEQE